MTELRTTNRWFSLQAEPVFEQYLKPLAGKIENYLEIGVCEGQSMRWIVEHLRPKGAVGIDPYVAPRRGQQKAYDKFKQNAYHNLAPWLETKEIVLIHEQSKWLMSDDAWKRLPADQYDLIYIDGSHRAWDVLLDAMLCWERLKRDGIMVFDDLQRRFVNGKPLTRPGVYAFVQAYDGRWDHGFYSPRVWGIRKIK